MWILVGLPGRDYIGGENGSEMREPVIYELRIKEGAMP